MAAARLDMRQVKRVFYLHFVERKGQAVIATALGLGKTTVGDYLRRLNKTELTSWHQIDSLCDRLTHNCHRIELLPTAESQRKLRAGVDLQDLK
jgi:hypothetical protein